MSGVQVVGPAQSLDGTQVIEVNGSNGGYQVGKLDLVILLSGDDGITCTLPPNPEAGEKHRFVSNFVVGITLAPSPGQQIIFNESGVATSTAPPNNAIPFVDLARIADVIWDNQGNWVADCCVFDNS